MMDAAPEALDQVVVEATIVGGHIVYRAGF